LARGAGVVSKPLIHRDKPGGDPKGGELVWGVGLVSKPPIHRDKPGGDPKGGELVWGVGLVSKPLIHRDKPGGGNVITVTVTAGRFFCSPSDLEFQPKRGNNAASPGRATVWNLPPTGQCRHARRWRQGRPIGLKRCGGNTLQPSDADRRAAALGVGRRTIRFRSLGEGRGRGVTRETETPWAPLKAGLTCPFLPPGRKTGGGIGEGGDWGLEIGDWGTRLR